MNSIRQWYERCLENRSIYLLNDEKDEDLNFEIIYNAENTVKMCIDIL